MINTILALFLFIGLNAFSQEYQIDDWGSFDFSDKKSLEANSYFQTIDRAIDNQELIEGDRATLVKLVYSYIQEPSLEKEKVLKTLLRFEDRLKASPLSGIQDGIVDHMRRITESLGIIDDFAAPVFEIMKSLESGVVDVVKDGVSSLNTDNIKPHDLANIREVAFKIFLYKMDENSRASAGTAITVSGSNKQYLLDYMFSLDLLKLAESSGVSDLYELVLVRTLLDYTNLSRQVQGLKYTIFGNFALVDWSYPLSERHRNLENPGLYFEQVKLMIKKSGRANKFRGEWSRTLRWMRRTLRKKKLNSHVRPLTTVLSSGILVGEIKLALLYAKINTYIISSRLLIENTSRTHRLYNRYVIVPALQNLMRLPAWMVGGALKLVHRLVSAGDSLISKANNKLKPHFNHCKYLYKNWFNEFRRNIY